MGKYTTELRYICEWAAGLDKSAGYNSIDNVIQSAIPVIFSFNFPMYDESYRNVLETKILKHFYTREIGLETYGLWKLKLETKLNEIMPFYNELYQTTVYDFDPFTDVDYTDTRTGGKTDESTGNETNTTESNSNGTVNGTVNSTNKYSDLPQGSVSDIDIQSNAYLTNATINSETSNTTNENTVTGNGTTNTTNKLTSTEEYVNKIVGKRGSQTYMQLVNEIRENIINIDMMIIDELECLFMQIW